MKIKRRDLMILGALAVVLAGVLYYYLFFQSYMTDRVSMREANEQAQLEINAETAKLGMLESMRAELKSIETKDDLLVRSVVETGDLFDKITSACGNRVSDLSMSFPGADEKGIFYSVSMSVSFTAKPSNLPQILRNIESIDICNRIFVGSLSFTDGNVGDCTVNLTVEFLYSTNILPPVRENSEETAS